MKYREIINKVDYKSKSKGESDNFIYANINFFLAQFQNIVLLCHCFERNLFEGTTLNIRMI